MPVLQAEGLQGLGKGRRFIWDKSCAEGRNAREIQMSFLWILIGVFAIMIVLSKLAEMGHDANEYKRGWRDCESAMKIMTEDDEAILKEMKSALSLYIKQTGLRRRGDERRIELVNDYESLRYTVEDLTVLRK